MLPAQVVINEIHYNSEPNTSHDEFVELYNAGTDPVDVSGWFFQQGINFTIPANTEIQGLSHLVIALRRRRRWRRVLFPARAKRWSSAKPMALAQIS